MVQLPTTASELLRCWDLSDRPRVVARAPEAPGGRPGAIRGRDVFISRRAGYSSDGPVLRRMGRTARHDNPSPAPPRLGLSCFSPPSVPLRSGALCGPIRPPGGWPRPDWSGADRRAGPADPPLGPHRHPAHLRAGAAPRRGGRRPRSLAPGPGRPPRRAHPALHRRAQGAGPPPRHGGGRAAGRPAGRAGPAGAARPGSPDRPRPAHLSGPVPGAARASLGDGPATQAYVDDTLAGDWWASWAPE